MALAALSWHGAPIPSKSHATVGKYQFRSYGFTLCLDICWVISLLATCQDLCLTLYDEWQRKAVTGGVAGYLGMALRGGAFADFPTLSQPLLLSWDCRHETCGPPLQGEPRAHGILTFPCKGLLALSVFHILLLRLIKTVKLHPQSSSRL